MNHRDREEVEAIVGLAVWVIALEIHQAKDQIMAAIDDLNVSVTNLQSAVSDLAARVDNTQQEPAIAAAATAVQGAADTLNTLAQPPAAPPVVEPTS